MSVAPTVSRAKRWRHASYIVELRELPALALEREVELGGLAVLHRHLAGDGLVLAELAVNRLDLVLASRQALDGEGAVLGADREVGVAQHRDEGPHPGVHVTTDRNQHLGLVESLLGLHALARLPDIELRVVLGAGMDVVKGIVAVADLELLAGD